MIIRRARTASLVRVLHAIGTPKPRRRPMPAQKQPDAIRRGYYKAILPEAMIAEAAFAHIREQIVKLLAEERRAQGVKLDAAGNKAKAKALVDRAAQQAARAFAPTEVYAAAEAYGERTSDFNREQLGRQVSAALSIRPSTVEPGIQPKIEEFAARNVELIRTVSDRYFDRIRLDVEDAFETGMRPDTLAELFIERDGMAERDALRIANDQIGKLNGQLNMERQTRLGVERYRWRTMNDDRVRDEHADLEGEECEWADPPDGGGTDGSEPGHPGSGISCRCYPEPIFDDILDTL